jgi:hypothetical protein
LAHPAITAHSATIPAKRIARIIFLPTINGTKNPIQAVNRD